MTWLETQCTMERLRVTNRQATLCLPRRWCSRPSIRVWTDTLSVSTGLLVMTNLGLMTRVWVTLTCRCRLLENLRGKWEVNLGSRFMLSRVRCIPLLRRVAERLGWMPRRFLFMTQSIPVCLPSEDRGLRKTTRTLPTTRSLSRWETSLPTPRFPQRTLLLEAGRTCRTVWLTAAPLSLSLFIRLKTLFPQTPKPVLRIVLHVPPLELQAMPRRPILIRILCLPLTP